MDSEKVAAALDEAKKVVQVSSDVGSAAAKSSASDCGKDGGSEAGNDEAVSGDADGGNDGTDRQDPERGEKRKNPEGESDTTDEKTADEKAAGEEVSFKVVFNKKKYDVSFGLDSDIAALKTHLQSIIEIHPTMMKVMVKGLAKDEMTLRQLGVTNGTKVMVIGSSIKDVLTITSTPSSKELKEEDDRAKKAAAAATSKEKMHKKVLDKGKPEDALPGIKGRQDPIPQTPLTGMLNKYGGKVRLTFKMEVDQLWISTKERTEKVPMNSIKTVVSEPIEGHEEYHMLALQLGPTEASRYWVYWVPAQYIEAIKDAILGKWAVW